MKCVLISGASGFIAGHLARKLKGAGFRVIGISRRKKDLPFFDSVYEGRLTLPLQAVFEDNSIKVFIHCACHVGKNAFQTNVEGTTLWAEQAKERNVSLQVFLSSISARENSPSSYGRSKSVLEKWFVNHGQLVFRLGWVVGNGGIFRRVVKMVRRYPVLPLPDSGRMGVYLIGVDLFADVLHDRLTKEEFPLQKNIWNLFQPRSFPLRMILDEIKKQLRVSCVFFALPSGLVLSLVSALEILSFSKPWMTKDNIIGLIKNPTHSFVSDLEISGFLESSLTDLIRRSLPKTD